jgi:hypothetical protein
MRRDVRPLPVLSLPFPQTRRLRHPSACRPQPPFRMRSWKETPYGTASSPRGRGHKLDTMLWKAVDWRNWPFLHVPLHFQHKMRGVQLPRVFHHYCITLVFSLSDDTERGNFTVLNIRLAPFGAGFLKCSHTRASGDTPRCWTWAVRRCSV